MTDQHAAATIDQVCVADDAQGFTLFEVVVATALVSLLGVMLFGGLRLGGRIMDKAAERTTAATQLAATFGFLRSQLGQAQPVLRGEKGAQTVVFEGRPDGVDFITVSPPHIGGQGFQRLSVQSGRGANGAHLIARWHSFSRAHTESVSATMVHESVLLDDIAAAEFSYLGKAGGAHTWQPRWQSRATLPALVRIRLSYAGRRPAEDLLVALRLGDA